jgi:hypothetical protein
VPHISEMLWAIATMRCPPNEGLLRELEHRAEAVADDLNAQGVVRTMWAFATMGRQPGDGIFSKLEARALVTTRDFTAEQLVNTMWAYGVLGRRPGPEVLRALEQLAESMAPTLRCAPCSRASMRLHIYTRQWVIGAVAGGAGIG